MKNKKNIANVRVDFGGRIFKCVVILMRAFQRDENAAKRPSIKEVMESIARLHEAALVYFGEEYANLIEERQLDRYKINRRRLGKSELPTIEEIAHLVLPLVDLLAIRDAKFSNERAARKLRLARRKFNVCVQCGQDYALDGSDRCEGCSC